MGLPKLSSHPVVGMGIIIVSGHIGWKYIQDNTTLGDKGIDYPHVKVYKMMKTRLLGEKKSDPVNGAEV